MRKSSGNSGVPRLATLSTFTAYSKPCNRNASANESHARRLIASSSAASSRPGKALASG